MPAPDGTTRHRSPAGTAAILAPLGSVITRSSPPPMVAEAAATASPIRSCGSAEATGCSPGGSATGSGGRSSGCSGAGCPGGASGTQLASAANPSASTSAPPRRRRRSAAVVAKLELDAEVSAPQHRDDGLQLVLGGAGHPDLVALDRGLGLPEAALLDRLHDLLGGILGN